MIKSLLFVHSLTLLTLVAFAQRSEIVRPDGSSITANSIDQKIQQLMTGAGVTGLSIGIIQDNKPSYIKSYGYKNKPLGLLNDVNTSLYAASFSKSQLCMPPAKIISSCGRCRLRLNL